MKLPSWNRSQNHADTFLVFVIVCPNHFHVDDDLPPTRTHFLTLEAHKFHFEPKNNDISNRSNQKQVKMSNSIANKSVSRRNVRCAKRVVRRGSPAEDTTEEWHDAVEFEDTTEEWHDAVESLSAMQLESIKQNKARKASPRCAKRVVRRRGQQVDSSLSAAENRTRTTRVRWQDPIVSSVMLIPGRAVEEERDAQDLGVEEPEVIVAPAPRRRAQTKRRATPGSQRPKTSLRRSSRLSGGDAPVNARRSLRLRSKPTTRYPA